MKNSPIQVHTLECNPNGTTFLVEVVGEYWETPPSSTTMSNDSHLPVAITNKMSDKKTKDKNLIFV